MNFWLKEIPQLTCFDLDHDFFFAVSLTFKHQPNKMVQHNQTICQLLATNFLNVFDHFVGLALEGLTQLFSHRMKLSFIVKISFPRLGVI